MSRADDGLIGKRNSCVGLILYIRVYHNLWGKWDVLYQTLQFISYPNTQLYLLVETSYVKLCEMKPERKQFLKFASAEPCC